MNPAVTLVSFLFFTGMVALLTYLWTRKEDTASNDGFFLAGRSLTFPFIAASLLLTNLSTEQMVGLNGSAFIEGLSVMVWEVEAVVAIVCMVLFFLPKFLKSGISTVPEFMEERYDKGALVITNLIFLVAYATILLPIVLYTGATGLEGILDMGGLTGIKDPVTRLWIAVWLIGILGSMYALWGGLRTVAVSDLLNGVLLLTGGLAITYFGLDAISGGQGAIAGFRELGNLNDTWMQQHAPDAFSRFNSLGALDQEVPFATMFTGVLVINLFYWCTNQQIIQRTLAAKSLAEGQKGVLLCGAMKLIGPLYLVLPGIMAFFLYQRGYFDDYLAEAGIKAMRSTDAYGQLVRHVLPPWMTGFFAAALIGAVLSSFNSALNATCTLFSLGVYKRMMHPDYPDAKVVASGRWFGIAVAVFAMCVAPLLYGQTSIFFYLQQMNTIYFIPIFATVLVGLLSKRVPPVAAKMTLVVGVVVFVVNYFVFRFDGGMNPNHFAGIVFVGLVILMLVVGKLAPRPIPWEHVYSGRVKDMQPWKFAKLASALLIALVLAIYISFSDSRVITKHLHVGVEAKSEKAEDGVPKLGLDMPTPLPKSANVSHAPVESVP